MFLHLKAGLDAGVIRLTFSQESYQLQRKPLSRRVRAVEPKVTMRNEVGESAEKVLRLPQTRD